MRKVLLGILSITILMASPARAEFALEQESDGGVTEVSDFSWRSYQEQLNRFPERIGFICYNAYILNKTPDHKAAFQFFSECARRGHAPSMINLSQFYAHGLGVEQSLETATDLLRQAALTGYPAAEYEYGKAVTAGEGVAPNKDLGRYWIAMAAAHGDDDAAQLLKTKAFILLPMPD